MDTPGYGHPPVMSGRPPGYGPPPPIMGPGLGASGLVLANIWPTPADFVATSADFIGRRFCRRLPQKHLYYPGIQLYESCEDVTI